MSKLFSLKEYLTVPATARHLSGIFDEEVSEADVLRLALDGHLKLSVNLVNHCMAKGGRIVPVIEARKAQSVDDENRFVILGIPLSPEEIFELHSGVIKLGGIWDLPMFGGEQLEVENEYQQLTDGTEVTLINMNGVFLGNRDVGLFQIQDDWADSDIHNKNAEGKKYGDPERYYPAGGLPKDAVIVVRTEALREFEQSINGAPTGQDKPLTTTERNTLLTIIAALCDHSAIEHQGRGAAIQIAKLTEELGAAVSDDAIRQALKKIPDALETRMK